MRFAVAGLSVCLGLVPAAAAVAQEADPNAGFEARVRAAERWEQQQRALLKRETTALIKLGVQAHGMGAQVNDVYAQWVEALRPKPAAKALLDAVAKARGRRPVGPDNVAAWEVAWKRFSGKWAGEWMELSAEAGRSGAAGDFERRFARRALGRDRTHAPAQELLRGVGVAALAPGPTAPITEGDWSKAWTVNWGPFAVKSDGPPNQVRRAVSWLERSLAWTREHCGGTFSCRFDAPIKVFVFGSRDSFMAEMRQMHRNRARAAAADASELWGFFSSRDSALHALLTENDDEGLRLVMQHEGVHAFLALGEPKGRHAIRKPGALAMEAVAVWAEQFTLGHDRWVADREAAGRLTALRDRLAAGERPTLASLFALTEYQMRRRTPVELYAWAAAVAWFFCEHSEPKRAVRMREAFLEYLRRWYTTEEAEPEATLAALTKQRWPALETEWQAMLSELAAKPK